MSDRTFDLQVSGYTKGGYAFTLTFKDVSWTKLDESLLWINGQLTKADVSPGQPEAANGLTSNPGWPDTKICPIHKEEMTRHEKGKSHWWSHKVISEDGSETWCRGK